MFQSGVAQANATENDGWKMVSSKGQGQVWTRKVEGSKIHNTKVISTYVNGEKVY